MQHRYASSRRGILPFFTRLRASALLSLAWPRESKQREGHPHTRALRTVPVLQVRERAAGFADSPSMDWHRTGPRRVGHPVDNPYARSPRSRGPDERASCAPEPKAKVKPSQSPAICMISHEPALSLPRRKRGDRGPCAVAKRWRTTARMQQVRLHGWRR